MADPLSAAEAKAALGDTARGRRPRAPCLTPEQAKRKLADTARGPDLRNLSRTQPLLAIALALAYGLMLGDSHLRLEAFLSLMNRAASR